MFLQQKTKQLMDLEILLDNINQLPQIANNEIVLPTLKEALEKNDKVVSGRTRDSLYNIGVIGSNEAASETYSEGNLLLYALAGSDGGAWIPTEKAREWLRLRGKDTSEQSIKRLQWGVFLNGTNEAYEKPNLLADVLLSIETDVTEFYEDKLNDYFASFINNMIQDIFNK